MANSPASDQEASYEKRVEALKLREQKVAKKDKELTQRLTDLDRRAALIQEAEDKQGAIHAREAAVDTQQREANLTLKEIKKRDKICKEVEQQQSEAEDRLFGKETYLNSQEKELNAKQAALADREKVVSDVQVENEDAERRLADRRKIVEKKEVDISVRLKEIDERERKSIEKRKIILDKEAELKDKLDAVTAKDAELNRAHEAVKQRHKETSQKEVEVCKERDRLNKRNIELSENETRIAAELKHLGLKKEEMARRVASVEESEQEVKMKTETFRVMANETTKKREIVEKHVVENRKYEDELNALKQELRVQEADLRGRERRLTGLQREHADREQVLGTRDEQLRLRQEQLRVTEVECSRREKDVGKREEHVEVFQAEVKQLQDRCHQKEDAMTKRQQSIEKAEKDLVEWMKEMEWREMMLGDREAVVDREPVTLPNTGVGSTSAGFSNKAFGHAMCEVQLRRLKDLYVSAQMKHAREELRTGKSPFQRHARLPRAGIVATLPSEDVGEAVERVSALKQQRQSVHILGVQFKRLMSRHRAFDSFEDLASPERLAHLEHFTPDERTVLCMAANMEYTLHGQEHLLVKLQRSPLDEKDKAANVQDLVNRISRWWTKTEEHVTHSLSQLLRDRERYLKHSVAILATKTGVLPSMINDRDTTAAARHTEEVHTSRSRSLSSDDSRHSSRRSSTSVVGVSEDEGATASPPLTVTPGGAIAEDDKPYTATTPFEHVKESKLLAPRGLATLKAVSEMSSSKKDAAASSPTSAAPVAAASGSGGGGHHPLGSSTKSQRASSRSQSRKSSHRSPVRGGDNHSDVNSEEGGGDGGGASVTTTADAPNGDASGSTSTLPPPQGAHRKPKNQQRERQRPATQQGHYSSSVKTGGNVGDGNTVSRPRTSASRGGGGSGIDGPRGVDMTPNPTGHDPESSTMFTGRAKPNRGRRFEERFDVLKVLATPPRPSPYTQKLHKLVAMSGGASTSTQKKKGRQSPQTYGEGAGEEESASNVDSELFPSPSGDPRGQRGAGARPRTTPN